MNGLSIKQMIDAGVHFGHRSKYWNPKMEPYIYTTHKKLHIINLEKSSERFNEAAKYIQKLISNNGKLMFIGTKRAASDIVKKYSDLRSIKGDTKNFFLQSFLICVFGCLISNIYVCCSPNVFFTS